ncbi:MAG: hypothetical protein ACR2PH_16545 [Desulfobulbia bacterium]
MQAPRWRKQIGGVEIDGEANDDDIRDGGILGVDLNGDSTRLSVMRQVADHLARIGAMEHHGFRFHIRCRPWTLARRTPCQVPRSDSQPAARESCVCPAGPWPRTQRWGHHRLGLILCRTWVGPDQGIEVESYPDHGQENNTTEII